MKLTIMQMRRLESKSGVAAPVKGCTDGEAVARVPLPVIPGMPLLAVPVAPMAPATLLLV